MGRSSGWSPSPSKPVSELSEAEKVAWMAGFEKLLITSGEGEKDPEYLKMVQQTLKEHTDKLLGE